MEKKMEIVARATEFCVTAHRGQTRKVSNLPYAIHPALVAWLVYEFKTSKNIDALMSAALLHDVIEDCNVTEETLVTEFGDLVSSLVVELSNDKTIKGVPDKYAYMTAKILTMSSYALTIKLCDFLANLSDCGDGEFARQFTSKIRTFTTLLEKHRKLTPTQTKILAEIKKML